MIAKARTPSTRSRWHSLPPDLLQQSCKRVAIMSLIFASLWAIALVMNNLVAPLLGHHHNMTMPWPYPGNSISWIGLAISLTTFFLVGRLKSKPEILLNVSHANMIAGAGLDVFENEPAVEPELLTMENVVLLPHIASASLGTRTLMATMASDNIVAHFHGQRPPNIVNPEVLG